MPSPDRAAPRLPRGLLLLMDLCGLAVEGVAIASAAYLLYGVQYGRAAARGGADIRLPGTDVLHLGAEALRPLLWLGPLFALSYALWRALWLRGLHRRSAAASLTPLEELNRIASGLPRQSLIVRPLLWLGCGVIYVGWLTARGLPAGGQIPLLWLFSLNPLLAGALHSLAYDRILWGRAFWRLGERPGELRRFAGRYSVELARATLLCTALAVLFATVVPFNLEQFQHAQRYLPGALLLLLYAGSRYGSKAAAPIRRYLRAALGPGGAPKEVAAAAYQAAQALPYRLGAAMVVAGVLFTAALLAILGPLLQLPGESMLLIVGVSLSVATATSLYAIVWHRFTLRTLLGHLRAQYAFHPDEVPAPLSLVRKMVYGFGLPVMCVCLLSLQWSFVQYKTLANHHVQRLARDRLETLREDLLRALGPEPRPEAALPELRRIVAQAGLAGECYVYYLPAGQLEAIEVGEVGAADRRAPRLPPYPLSHLRLREGGSLDLPRLDLTGAYERITAAGRPLGTVAVLYPNYRHPGLRGQGQGQDPLRGQLLGLIAFFVVLMFASGGVVVIAAVDLSRPLRYLERRAAAMAQGDLSSPVVQTAVEVDEAGALAVAFEDMRQALAEMLRSSTETNQELEAEVERRTQELSRRNQEVSEAMTRLQLARGELVRAEKLATMGRIAASVTSEINNPVNAMVTIPDPLEAELGELERLLQERPLRRERIVQAVGELRKMTDVLHRSAQRAKEIVHATRIYARLGDDKEGEFDLGQAASDVLQLFAELLRFGVRVRREVQSPLPVRAVRSDLGQLLSGWLARRAPLLREAAFHAPEGRGVPPGGGAKQVTEIVVQARRVPGAADSAAEPAQAELTLSDSGPPLADAELQAARADLPPGVEVGSAVEDGTPRTWLRLRLPLAGRDAPPSGPQPAGAG